MAEDVDECSDEEEELLKVEILSGKSFDNSKAQDNNAMK